MTNHIRELMIAQNLYEEAFLFMHDNGYNAKDGERSELIGIINYYRNKFVQMTGSPKGRAVALYFATYFHKESKACMLYTFSKKDSIAQFIQEWTKD